MAGVLRIAQKGRRLHDSGTDRGRIRRRKELFARAIHGSGATQIETVRGGQCGAIPTISWSRSVSVTRRAPLPAQPNATPANSSKLPAARCFSTKFRNCRWAAQVKLLRALQEGAVEAVGGRKPMKVDVRIVSATNRKLLDHVKSGQFAKTCSIASTCCQLTIPPLRMRREGHSASAAALSGEILCRRKSPDHRHQRRGDGPVVAARLARKHSPA